MKEKAEQGTDVPVKYLNAQQVADRYGMTLQWVYGCRSLPRRKLGKYLRFLPSELEVWEKRQTGTGRVFAFHVTDMTEVRTRPKGTQREIEEKKPGGAFALQFDLE